MSLLLQPSREHGKERDCVIGVGPTEAWVGGKGGRGEKNENIKEWRKRRCRSENIVKALRNQYSQVFVLLFNGAILLKGKAWEWGYNQHKWYFNINLASGVYQVMVLHITTVMLGFSSTLHCWPHSHFVTVLHPTTKLECDCMPNGESLKNATMHTSSKAHSFYHSLSHARHNLYVAKWSGCFLETSLVEFLSVLQVQTSKLECFFPLS